MVRSQEIVRLVKTEYNPAQYDVPEVFSVHSRSLLFHQLPDHAALKQLFRTLAERKGYNLQGPLDWTPCDSIRSGVTPMKEPDCSLPSDHEDGDCCEASGYEMPTNNYFARDTALWDPQGDRDKDLTLPSDQEVALNGRIACIVDVIKGGRRT